jgi:hypothetical protein
MSKITTDRTDLIKWASELSEVPKFANIEMRCMHGKARLAFEGFLLFLGEEHGELNLHTVGITFEVSENKVLPHNKP